MIDQAKVAGLLEGKRWFGGGGRSLEHAEVSDYAVIEDGPPALVTALVRVRFRDGGEYLYHLPLLVDEDGGIRDAFEDVERLRSVGDLMAHGTSLKGERGTFVYGGAGLDPMAPPGARSARAIGAEQSNTSVVLDDEVIVKLFRRVEPGPNPDLEINRMLTTEGFPFIPAQVGEIAYEGDPDGGEETIDLGIAQRFLPDAEEGWTHMLVHIRTLFDEVHEHDVAEDVPQLTAERAEHSLRLVDELADTTAAMHVALAREGIEADFAPEPVESHDVTDWVEGAHAALRVAMRSGEYGTARLEEAISERIDRLRNVAPELLGNKIRIHGDYHLGQVLRAPREWLVIDFEGEPLRPLEERRAKQSPLRDVAGMLRSLSYAVTAVLFERAQPDDAQWARLQPWADAWETEARDRFLHAYCATSHEGRFLPPDRDALAILVDTFEIDKALYELRYERAHRPEWTRIPLEGIERVLERSDAK